MQRCNTRMIFIATLLMLIVPGWSMEKPLMSQWSTGIVLAVVLLTVLAPGRGQEPNSDPDLTKEPTLYVVGSVHLDTQWIWMYPQVIREMIPRTMHGNFRLFELYPNYVFSFSGANRYRMMKEYHPADYEKVKQYVEAGRWRPCGSSMEECDVNVPSAESLIRQVLYGNHYFRTELGKDSAEFILPDCFGFPASLPSILGHCGLKGFSTQKLSWGSAVGIPFNVGIWEGLDGTEIIAALNPGDYCAKLKEDLSASEEWLKRIEENGKQSGVYVDYKYYGSPGDEGGCPTDESVEWLEKSIASAGPVRVIAASAEQMFLDIPTDKLSALPRYKGDLLLVEHSAGSITSAAYMKRWNRKNELLADAAERASVLAEWIGGPEYPRARLNNAWTLVMGGQFHDILPGTSHPKAYEYSWNDEILALNQFAGVLDSAVGTIATGLDTKAKGVPIVVYNPLSIERQDVVEAEVNFSGTSPKAVRVIGPDGKEAPSQILSVDNGTLKILFLATAPSVGYAVYDVQPVLNCMPTPSPLTVTESSLENERYRVTLDGNSDVASIFDKAADRELLSSPLRLAFQHESPRQWPAWNMDWDDQQKPPRAYVAGPAKVRIAENGPARVAIEVVRDSEGSRFVQTIRLSAGDAGNRVEFSDTVDWRSRECALKAVFPLTVANPMATYNWEVGTIARGNNDPQKYEVPAHQWFDLTDVSGDYGVTVLSDCKYGSDKPDDRTLRLTLIYTPGMHPESSFHEFYAQTTQDFGRHELLYGLAGHIGDWRQGQTDWHAWRLEQPLIAFQTATHEGRLGRAMSLLKVSDPRVRAMAVKKAEDSDEIIVRLVELNGKPAKDVHVAFTTPIIAAREVNGQEQQIGDAKVVAGELVTDIGGYRLRTFALKLGAAPIQTAPAQSQPIQLAYNRRVTSCDEQKSNGGFDSEGRALPGEMLPAEIAYRGVTFDLGPAIGGQPNAVTCKGQTIALPEGKFNRLYLMAAADGDRTAKFSIDDKPTELTIRNWNGYIGQWDTRIWKGHPKEYDFNQPPENLVGLSPAYVCPDPVAWFCSHHHTAGGQNALYEYCYLFAYAIDLQEGAKTLKLPKNNNIHILAATVTNDLGVDTHPAQPLYDELKRDNTLDLPISPAGE